jgi:two-component system response regulator MprA
MRLLLVEDDSMIGAAAQQGLRQEGYIVDWVRDGREAEAAVANGVDDLVLLDLGLPRRDGLALLRGWRARNEMVPALIVTARDAVADRVAGLDAGADDYLVKPFALSELVARIRVRLRRRAARADPELRFADVRLDPGLREANRGERTIPLTNTEYELLRLFLLNPKQVLSRDRIYERVWGYEFVGESKVIEVYVRYLREKLEAGGEPRLIHTLRGVGYVLKEPA